MGRPGKRTASHRSAAALPLVLVAMFLVLPTAAAVPYLQHQVDATRAGVTTDPGPDRFDVAFTVQLPGGAAHLSEPLIIDDAVYALVDVAGQEGVYRINTATVDVDRVVELDGPPSSMASDGERLFVATASGIEAYDLRDWRSVWSWSFPTLTSVPGRTQCAPLAIDGDALFAACTQGVPTEPEIDDNPLLQTSDVGHRSFVSKLAVASGEPDWTAPWDHSACDEAPLGQCGDAEPYVTSLAVSDRRVVVGGMEVAAGDQTASSANSEWGERVLLSGIDRETGQAVWRWSWAPFGPDTPELFPTGNTVPAPGIVATAEVVYILTWDLTAVSVDDGAVIWSERVTRVDIGRGQPGTGVYHGSGLAYARDRVYASGAQEIVAFDVRAGQAERVWRTPLATGDLDQMYGLHISRGRVTGSTYQGHLFALSADTGEMGYFEDHGIGGGLRRAVGEGVIVAMDSEGTLTVLGETAASPTVTPSVSNTYPAPGEQVVVDMSQVGAGALGNVTSFQVDWGDGTRDAWQDEPEFEHAFDRAGEFEAVMSVRNDAGQTASRSVAFHVGGSPDNVVSTAFAPENQDLTFGVIGIVLALGGGLVAIGRRQRQRGRLHDELEAIERAYEQNKARPRDCEAALSERRAHVQGLALDGKLDEGHVGLLERRIDELSRELRLGTIEQRFHFLPYGFVMSLREMLDDGIISIWEREHLEHAIDRDRTMTDGQKAKVRGLLDEWVERDSGVDG